jgi:hypothetical protein
MALNITNNFPRLLPIRYRFGFMAFFSRTCEGAPLRLVALLEAVAPRDRSPGRELGERRTDDSSLLHPDVQ